MAAAAPPLAGGVLPAPELTRAEAPPAPPLLPPVLLGPRPPTLRPLERLQAQRPTAARFEGDGRLAILRSRGPWGSTGGARALRYVVEAEGGLATDAERFATRVEDILSDPRGWEGGGLVLRRVASPPADFRVTLASPRMTDRLCAPLETRGHVSCQQRGRAVINFWRWVRGADTYGTDVRGYRRYVVNHEVGHALGHSGHADCPRAGARAPVMMQQTLAVGSCRTSSWPLPAERQGVAPR